MDNEILSTIVIGAPNFVGFVMAITLLYKRLRSQDHLIGLLVEKWERCEDSTEREKLLATGSRQSEL